MGIYEGDLKHRLHHVRPKIDKVTVNEGCAKEYGWSLNNVITGAPFKISERPDVVLPEPYHSTIVNDSDHAQRQNYSTSYTEMDGYRAEVTNSVGVSINESFTLPDFMSAGIEVTLNTTSKRSEDKTRTKNTTVSNNIEIPARTKVIVKVETTITKVTAIYHVPIEIRGKVGTQSDKKFKGHYYWGYDIKLAYPKGLKTCVEVIGKSFQTESKTEIAQIPLGSTETPVFKTLDAAKSTVLEDSQVCNEQMGCDFPAQTVHDSDLLQQARAMAEAQGWVTPGGCILALHVMAPVEEQN